ncbi:MAG TPA: hypothetical protein VI685_17750 [Candidatus Angelobacter sp.]
MRNAVISFSIMIMLLPAISLLSAVPDQEWLTPAYPAQPSDQHTVTLKYSYIYQERQFMPSYSLEALPKNRWEFTSPESAMIARGAAMRQLDYEGWLTTWDELSKSLMEQRAKEHHQELSAVIDQWKGILEAGKMTMVRRIQTGPYVILTYRIVDDAGKDIGQIELPSVFHLVEGRWLGTQDLSRDILLLESPWVTGQQHVERTME